ncbi:MAG: ATP synthase F1 subunit delta [Gemmatimonadetes bacterium]|nr:ATP synthase F1 subunit delta [Gemmatimonadota bacterium]
MRIPTVARNYAETLFELGRRHDAVEAFGRALDEFVRLLGEVPGFRLFLETPRVAAQEKKRVLRAVLEGKVPKLFLHFLLVIVDKRRQRLFPGIAAAYHDLVDQHFGRERVEVLVAREIEPQLREDIADRLSALLGKTAIPEVRVRPQILGGIVVRAGHRILDGSLRRQIDELRRRMLRAPLPLRAAG